MRRLASALRTAALLTAGLASPAWPQDPLARQTTLVDVGLYAGGAWNTDWYEIGGETYRIGVAPLFGVQGTYWLSPTIGVRLHGAHMPSRVPESGGGAADTDWAVSNWLYDLGVVYRPWAWGTGVGQFRGSTYFVVGVGGITSNAPAPTAARSSVAVDVGVGAAVARLSSRYALFGELGTYLYRGPVHRSAAVNPTSALTVVGKIGLRRGWE